MKYHDKEVLHLKPSWADEKMYCGILARTLGYVETVAELAWYDVMGQDENCRSCKNCREEGVPMTR